MSRKRWMWIGAAGLLLIGLGYGAWSLRGEYDYAHIATGYAAKQTCSCMYVSGRTMESCMSDYTPEQRENFVMTEDGDRIRASVLFGAISAEAQYEDGYGCRILD